MAGSFPPGGYEDTDPFIFSDPEDSEDPNDFFSIKNKSERHPVANLTHTYSKRSRLWLIAITKTYRTEFTKWLATGNSDQILNAIETVSWYNFFIYPKILRALSGHFEMEEDELSADDMNGSAKVVLIAIDKSIDAFIILDGHLTSHRAEKTAFAELLKSLRNDIEKKPYAAYYRVCQCNPETTAQVLAATLAATRKKKTSTMRPIIYLFFILFVASLVSCKKNEPPVYTISDGMKQFFVYQKGSYWIYTNDSTNLTDSTYVNNVIYSNQGIGDDGRHLYSFDLISLYFTSQFLSNYIIGNICEEIVPKLMMENNNGFNIVAYVEGLVPNQEINTKCGSPSGDILYEEFPSITINSVTYSTILHTTVTTQNNSQKYSFYFAKNVGLIQYQYKENNTIKDSWSLKRHKVIQ